MVKLILESSLKEELLEVSKPGVFTGELGHNPSCALVMSVIQ